MSPAESPSCTDPMWTLVGARIARFWIARLGSVHLPVGTRDGHAPCSGVHVTCTGGAGERVGARGAWRARGACAGAWRARGVCAGARAGARLAHGWHYSPESDDSSPEMH
ncbi:hypothetical protein CRG98_040285 [Punica granatum]|uniref:Uncharacterized protein n=1 Tax=Punica granatum TaxID=22663 RepID=A0A2I0I686_PUNGR|nr:hypothetical protein CRG98_040285 [Punica granatum]